MNKQVRLYHNSQKDIKLLTDKSMGDSLNQNLNKPFSLTVAIHPFDLCLLFKWTLASLRGLRSNVKHSHLGWYSEVEWTVTVKQFPACL